MTLTIMALHFWPWELIGDANETLGGFSARKERLIRYASMHGPFVPCLQLTRRSLRLSLLLAAIAVLLRPTNVLIWATVVMVALTRFTLRGRNPITLRVVFILFREALLCGGAALTLSGLSDRLYFGQWTFPPYHTMYFNLSQDLAVFYGEMDWHYYLSQGITQLAMTFLPFVLVGLYKFTTSFNPAATAMQSNALRTMSFAVITTIMILSFISHKEVRFIYPLLPILHILAAPSFAAFFTAPPGHQPSQTKTLILTGLLFVNLIIATYLSILHAAAPISVMHFIRHKYEHIYPERLGLHPSQPVMNHYHTFNTTGEAPGTDELFALFLTPCHTTPWRSRLIYPHLRARALTCEPPVHTAPRSAERSAYRDETKRFYHGFGGEEGVEDWGVGFLGEEMWPLLADTDGKQGVGKVRGGEVPRYIVGFESIEPMLTTFFDKEKGGPGGDMGVRLKKVWTGWNGLFSDDERKEGWLCVWDTGVFPEPVVSSS